MLKAYIVTGCDETRKLGTKASAVDSKAESYLEDFDIESMRDSRFVSAKTYCESAIDLQNIRQSKV